MINSDIEFIVRRALKEDIGAGDITTNAIYSGSEVAKGELKIKQHGIIAGLEVAGYIFQEIDPKINFQPKCEDGTFVEPGMIAAVVEGPSNKILTGERTMLNFLQRMSGIATRTRQFVEAVSGTSAKILDTRKTVPGHRYLDKWAVRLGGGTNHRMRLDDRFLIKENHIAVAGSISEAIALCVNFRNQNKIFAKIEIEVRNFVELEEVLSINGVDYIMLDNMKSDEMRQAVDRVGGRVPLEASGNISLENVKEIAETGVDYISVGSLTHSVRALDVSLLFE